MQETMRQIFSHFCQFCKQLFAVCVLSQATDPSKEAFISATSPVYQRKGISTANRVVYQRDRAR